MGSRALTGEKSATLIFRDWPFGLSIHGIRTSLDLPSYSRTEKPNKISYLLTSIGLPVVELLK